MAGNWLSCRQSADKLLLHSVPSVASKKPLRLALRSRLVNEEILIKMLYFCTSSCCNLYTTQKYLNMLTPFLLLALNVDCWHISCHSLPLQVVGKGVLGSVGIVMSINEQEGIATVKFPSCEYRRACQASDILTVPISRLCTPRSEV